MGSVFISHAVDDPDWPPAAVDALAARLREAGAAVRLDTWRDAEIGRHQSDGEWRGWMLDSLDAAATVLCLASPLYVERTRRQGAGAPRGRGVAFEFFHIEQRLYDEHQGRDGWVWLLLPANAQRASHVPAVLRGACPEYRMPADEARLLAHVLGRGLVEGVVAAAVPSPAPVPKPVPTPTGPAWASASGQDAEGHWADLTIPGEGITQRLRWIPPGEFWMGSPLTEQGRHDDEGPRHRVRLTEGFWLADTACTQALWRAVMGGGNPSQFTGDLALPVENVNWDEVQGFLQRLQVRLPRGYAAALPTEAEWEYACRAGTDTPFAFGADVSLAQVNVDGNRPYAGGRKGEYRQRTVPVKALPANGWGLYQMHGNVWEWCADVPRLYADVQDPATATKNPVGPPNPNQEALRTLRGGSWFPPAWAARSAYRNVIPRGFRSMELGFRFALRSTGPGGAGSR